jgi:hypothetical protein
MPIKDSLIAATALVHGLTMVTWNRADFEKAGALRDQWGGSLFVRLVARATRSRLQPA